MRYVTGLTEISMMIVATAFQPVKVIYGEVDQPWAEKYQFEWTNWIKLSPNSVSVNRVTVHRRELLDSYMTNVPQASNPLHRQDSVAVLVNKLRSKEVTSP